MQGFGWYDMFMNGWPVLTVLLFASVYSWTVMVDRLFVLRRRRVDAKAFVVKVLEFLDADGLQGAIEYCDRHATPVSRVVRQVLMHKGGREDLERIMQHAVQEETHEMERWISGLATVGSTAPFVGLLGTVVGIIKAFRQIALNVGGGPEVVSAGIAEALITTAFGLVVAIPAVVGYNYFANALRRMAEKIELAVFVLIEKRCGGPSGERQ